MEALAHEGQHVREAELREEVNHLVHGDSELDLLLDGPGEEPGAVTVMGQVEGAHADQRHDMRAAPEACPIAGVYPGHPQGREHEDRAGLRQEFLRDPLEVEVGVTRLVPEGAEGKLLRVPLRLARELIREGLDAVQAEHIHDRPDLAAHAPCTWL